MGKITLRPRTGFFQYVYKIVNKENKTVNLS